MLFYVCGKDVYCLNVTTRRRTHICILPFEARCTGSGEGWICIGGGDDGHFGAVKIESFIEGTEASNGDRFPLDLSDYVVGSREPRRSSISCFIERAGDEIVNSISIHRLKHNHDNSDEVVAVLTNNDKTVRVYSLTHGLEDTVLELPFPTNHATISPSGDLMVAVGDYHQAHFFLRDHTSQSPTVRRTRDTQQDLRASRWLLLSVVQLHVQPPSLNTGYFTTAWSPSGHLCAVGSECGYITLFDTDLVATAECGEEAILQIIPSSRPDTVAGPGAVRTMLFSPEPWDLLIWSEDQGRVGLADIRSNLQMKQIVKIDVKEKYLKHKHVVDTSDDFGIALRRFYGDNEMTQNLHDTLDSNNLESHEWISDHLDAFTQRRRLARDERGNAGDVTDEVAGLTSQERQILEGLRVARHRVEARQRRDILQEVNDAFPPLGGDNRRTSRLTMSHNPQLSMTAELSQLPAQRTRHDGSPLEQYYSRTEPSYRSRRRSSMTLNDGSTASISSRGTIRVSNPTLSPAYSIPQPQAPHTTVPPHAQRIMPNPSSSSQTEDRDTGPTVETITTRSPLSSPSLRPSRPIGDDIPQDQSTPTSRDRSDDQSNNDVTTDIRRIQQLARARARVRSMQATHTLRAYEAAWRRRPGVRLHDDSSWGVQTAGLAMSSDGRALYVGCEEGIFELGINIHERKFWPSVKVR